MPVYVRTPRAGISWDLVAGPVRWNDSGEIVESDDRYAIARFEARGSEETEWLIAYDFRFEIPPTEIVVGVVVESEVHSDRSDFAVVDKYVRLGYGIGAWNGEDRISEERWPDERDVIRTHGGAADRWRAELNPAIVNGGEFCVGFKASIYRSADCNAYVDWIQMTVYTEEPPVTVWPGSLDFVLPRGVG